MNEQWNSLEAYSCCSIFFFYIFNEFRVLYYSCEGVQPVEVVDLEDVEPKEVLESRLLVDSDEDGVTASDLPLCWSMENYTNHKQSRPWLLCKGRKLGCKNCSNVGHFNDFQKLGKGKYISQEWANTRVECNGTKPTTMQASLRKKIRAHEHSEAHMAAVNISKNKNTVHDNPLKRQFDKGHSHMSEKTSRCFLTAYKAAKNARSFLDYESDILLQELNGLDMGRILHSDVTCASITSHIAVEMRKQMLNLCIERKCKFSVLLDESTSLSKKSCLIVYIRSILCEGDEPVTFFLSLVELEGSSACAIKEALLKCLHQAGFTEQYCQQYWLAIATDGCSTMLGRKNGLIAQLQLQYSSLIPWHCAAHRLELAVGDALKDNTATNSFKFFLEKLYSIYSMSPKNQRELMEVAQEVNVELLKVGKIFSIRWVASSVRTVKAVWQNLPALYEHFRRASVDESRSSTEKNTFDSLANHVSSRVFLRNLALMYDSLHELSGLSQDLQSNSINIQSAHSKFLLLRQLFVSLKTRKGRHEREIPDDDVQSYKGIPLSDSRGVSAINRQQFIQSLVDKLDERMFTNASTRGADNTENKLFYEEIVSDMKVLDKSRWTPEQVTDPGFGDEAINRAPVQDIPSARE